MRVMTEEQQEKVEIVSEIKALSSQILENFKMDVPSPRMMTRLRRSCADILAMQAAKEDEEN